VVIARQHGRPASPPGGRAVIHQEDAARPALRYRQPQVPPVARLTSVLTSPVAAVVLGALLTAGNVLAVVYPPGVPRAAVVLVSVASPSFSCVTACRR